MSGVPRLAAPIAGGLCVVLALVLWAELSPDDALPEAVARPMVQAPQAGQPPVPGQAGLTAAQADAWVGTGLGRPLFSPDRRPSPASASAGPVPRAAEGLPRLTGTMVGGRVRRAFFAAEGSGRPRAAAEGEAIGRWTVVAIDPAGVTLDEHGVRTMLHPTRAAPPR